MSDGNVERKMEGFSGVSEKVASGKVSMGAGTLKVGADAVAVAEAAS